MSVRVKGGIFGDKERDTGWEKLEENIFKEGINKVQEKSRIWIMGIFNYLRDDKLFYEA